MKAQDIERFKEKLAAFMADLIELMGRTERRRYAEMYIRGLLMDGERKSIEPMAQRVPDGDVQGVCEPESLVSSASTSFFGSEGGKGICTRGLLDY